MQRLMEPDSDMRFLDVAGNMGMYRCLELSHTTGPVENRLVEVRSFTLTEDNEFYVKLAQEIHETARIPGDYTEKAEEWKTLVAVCMDESLRRYCESRVNVLTATTRAFKQEYVSKLTNRLIGTEACDGLVFDPSLKAPSALQDLLTNNADPNARDRPYGFTPSHAMAWSASLMSAFPESWHLDRLRHLRRAGGDIRCAVDTYGRSSLLLALENSNVQFIKSILRVSLGEQWALHQMRHMQLFTPNGKLLQRMLAVQKNDSEGEIRLRPRPGLSFVAPPASNNLRALLLQDGVYPMFRMPNIMFSGIHCAALHDDAPTIEILVHLDLPVNLQANVQDVYAELPLVLACRLNNFNAVEMLMRCNADPLLQVSSGEDAFQVARKADASARERLTTLLNTHHLPFQQVLWGKKLCWDSVGVLAKLFENGTVEVSSVEDVCNWYVDLGVEPQERVSAFWRLAAEKLEVKEIPRWARFEDPSKTTVT